MRIQHLSKNTNNGVHLPAPQQLTNWSHKSFWVVFNTIFLKSFHLFSCALLFKFCSLHVVLIPPSSSLTSVALMRSNPEHQSKNFWKTQKQPYTHMLQAQLFPIAVWWYRCTSCVSTTTRLDPLNPINGIGKRQMFATCPHAKANLVSLRMYYECQTEDK